MNFIEKIKNAAMGRSKSDSINTPCDQEDQETMSDATDPSVIKKRLERLKTLTPREHEIYAHLMKGLSYKLIS